MRIAAAGSKFSARRPPSRRPKNRPGKPKDFVFVDLSPIKSPQQKSIDATSTVSATNESRSSPKEIQIQVPSQMPSQLPSPALSTEEVDSKIFELPQLNDSFSSISDDDSIFSQFEDSKLLDSAISDYMQANNHCTAPAQHQAQDIGLGIMNLDVDWEAPQSIHNYSGEVEHKMFNNQQALFEQNCQLDMLQEQLHHSPAYQMQSSPSPQPQLQSLPLPKPSQTSQATKQNAKKRSKSTSDASSKRKNSGQIQFKTYTGPKKKAPRHRHSCSDSFIKPTIPEINFVANSTLNSCAPSAGFDDLMMFNDQMLPCQNAGSFTPVTDYSDEEDVFTKSKDFDSNLLGCGLEQYLPKTENFDFSSFIELS
jgi:hypothetical protein